MPVRPSSAGALALTGAWDMPARTGEAFYDWPDGNGVEPYVDAGEIVLGGRELTFSGLCRGNGHEDLVRKIKAFSDFIGALPARPVEFSCKWGRWQVVVGKSAEIRVLGYGKQDATVRLSLKEPHPDLSGAALPPEQSHNGGIDKYAWRSLGLGVTLSSGRYATPTRKALKVTETPGQPLFVGGGLDKREITFEGYLAASGYEAFTNRLKALYHLFGSPGLRRIVSMGEPFDCFCMDGFRISDVRVTPGKAFGQFSIKLVVVEK